MRGLVGLGWGLGAGAAMGWVCLGLGLPWVGFAFGWVCLGLGLPWAGFAMGMVLPCVELYLELGFTLGWVLTLGVGLPWVGFYLGVRFYLGRFYLGWSFPWVGFYIGLGFTLGKLLPWARFSLGWVGFTWVGLGWVGFELYLELGFTLGWV